MEGVRIVADVLGISPLGVFAIVTWAALVVARHLSTN